MKKLLPYFIAAAICLLVGYFTGAAVVLRQQQKNEPTQQAEQARINEYINSLNLSK